MTRMDVGTAAGTGEHHRAVGQVGGHAVRLERRACPALSLVLVVAGEDAAGDDDRVALLQRVERVAREAAPAPHVDVQAVAVDPAAVPASRSEVRRSALLGDVGSCATVTWVSYIAFSSLRVGMPSCDGRSRRPTRIWTTGSGCGQRRPIDLGRPETSESPARLDSGAPQCVAVLVCGRRSVRKLSGRVSDGRIEHRPADRWRTENEARRFPGGASHLSRVECRRRPTLPHPGECSTIGAGGLSFRVRDGTGRSPSANTTDNTIQLFHPSPTRPPNKAGELRGSNTPPPPTPRNRDADGSWLCAQGHTVDANNTLVGKPSAY